MLQLNIIFPLPGRIPGQKQNHDKKQTGTFRNTLLLERRQETAFSLSFCLRHCCELLLLRRPVTLKIL